MTFRLNCYILNEFAYLNKKNFTWIYSSACVTTFFVFPSCAYTNRSNRLATIWRPLWQPRGWTWQLPVKLPQAKQLEMWPENALNPIWRDFGKFGDRCDNHGGGLDNFPKFHDNRTNSLGVHTGHTYIHTYFYIYRLHFSEEDMP